MRPLQVWYAFCLAPTKPQDVVTTLAPQVQILHKHLLSYIKRHGTANTKEDFVSGVHTNGIGLLSQAKCCYQKISITGTTHMTCFTTKNVVRKMMVTRLCC